MVVIAINACCSHRIVVNEEGCQQRNAAAAQDLPVHASLRLICACVAARGCHLRKTPSCKANLWRHRELSSAHAGPQLKTAASLQHDVSDGKCSIRRVCVVVVSSDSWLLSCADATQGQYDLGIALRSKGSVSCAGRLGHIGYQQEMRTWVRCWSLSRLARTPQQRPWMTHAWPGRSSGSRLSRRPSCSTCRCQTTC